ncbi:Methylase of polypeptide chain release factors [Hahella chejuensis KCTC 2396]|uniref:Release factor glutamine methyltransferase n=1 Tax=Hahella chejuensis (strain KCTC 2396) TaxID=349521 RepID=Q2SL94_HAHCH|nr:peptide chain release factor N(5)-glutamine methyltransferase [Hahella chejuensis]ABC28580.1 Methylase of polypeptide chain release factors [Hahella chejuensis KCTC 2396]
MRIDEALAWAKSRLETESPRLDAEVLLAHVLGKGRTYLISHNDSVLDEPALQAYQRLIAERETGRPVAHLIGKREFWSLEFQVSPATLIPRPETELLVELVLEEAAPAGAKVLDLGTGTGAIACALAHERPDWRFTAVDVSQEAVELATTNVLSLGLTNVRCLRSNWYDAVGDEQFHVIVSNPPYIDALDIHLTQGDVRFEPASALVAADHGLADIRMIAAGAGRHLLAGGLLAVEHGYDQGAAAREIFSTAGYVDVRTHQDLAGHDRITLGRLPE